MIWRYLLLLRIFSEANQGKTLGHVHSIKREELFALGEFLSTLKNLKALDVLPYHDMAKPKYENLGIEYPLGDTPPLTKEEAIKAREIIMEGIKSGLKKQ